MRQSLKNCSTRVCGILIGSCRSSIGFYINGVLRVGFMQNFEFWRSPLNDTLTLLSVLYFSWVLIDYWWEKIWHSVFETIQVVLKIFLIPTQNFALHVARRLRWLWGLHHHQPRTSSQHTQCQWYKIPRTLLSGVRGVLRRVCLPTCRYQDKLVSLRLLPLHYRLLEDCR